MSSSIKKITTAFGIIILLLGFSLNKVEAKTGGDISLQVFYDQLSPYGEWVNNPDYGYVWRPNAGRDFKPYYTNGHWVMTEYGNTWVSNYDWGWAPFHYGRWFYDDYDGWVWAPDTEWGPAWVTWRTGGGYYGWAPLAPRISINIHFGRRHYIPDNYWVFIPQRCIYYPSYNRYWNPRQNIYIVHNTTIINNIYTNRNVRYYSGPRPDEVRNATRQDVPIYRMADNTRPGASRVDKGTVNIYRPDVSRDNKNDAPRTIASSSSRPSRADNNSPNYRSGDAADNARSGVNGNSNNSSGNRPERSADNNVIKPDAASNNDRSDSPSRAQPVRSERPTSNRPEAPVRTESQEPTRSPQPSRSEPSSRPSRVERSQPSRSVERSAPSRSSDGGGSSGRSNRPSRNN
ncbi:hypothetical protein I5M32_00905 [Pedobacter sp. SD-b]|uniref:YXWGXW repeat-containing protein n=1 Tax=Pedobacter segetis TaxID=2793069 RepID=A0ABS1BGZ2_9SPHI|nr:DUF6600 domain-containing protein [Pedobacter segetis]MBK0381504.1 hypothetical protein [Pedobacter segetis]